MLLAVTYKVLVLAHPLTPLWDSTNHYLDVYDAGWKGLFTSGATVPTTVVPALGITNTAASGASTGSVINLAEDDGAALAGSDRLGAIVFKGVADNTHTLVECAKIEGTASNGTLSGSNYGGRISFSTVQLNTTTELEALTITTDSNVARVGVNCRPASTAFQVQAPNTGVAWFINTGAGASNAGAGMIGYSDAGATLSNGFRLGFFALGGAKDNAHTLANALLISGFATENWTSSATGAELRFETTANGGTSRVAQMTLGNDGVLTLNSHKITGVANATAATDVLTFGQYVALPVVTKTSAYAAGALDVVIRCNGTFAVTLPAATATGKHYYIKNVGTGVITITPAGTDKIDGQSTIVSNSQYDDVEIIDGASGAWDIL
jgi:hypothetical protein